MKRRSFIKKSLQTASLVAAPTILPAAVWNSQKYTLPNDKINLGFIGVGGMGTGHLRSFIGYDDVNIVSVCDVQKNHRDRAKSIVDEKYGNQDVMAIAAYLKENKLKK